jgi:hypothetical protein
MSGAQADAKLAQKRKNDAIMKLQAIYCSNVEFNLTHMGLRLTFGEQSLMAGELPTHHVAVFLPNSMIEPFLQTLGRVMADKKANETK